MWADLLYVQKDLGESGLKQALSCLVHAPILVYLRVVDQLWESRTGVVLDAGLVAAVALSPLDINVAPGVAAAVVGALVGGSVVAVVTGFRAGIRMGLMAGILAALLAGSLAGVSGLDAGVTVGLDNFDTLLACVLVVFLILRLLAELHFRSDLEGQADRDS